MFYKGQFIMTKNIALMGIAALFLVLLSSLFLLQKSPQMQAIKNLSHKIQEKFILDKVVIVRGTPPQPVSYRVLISTHFPVEGEPRKMLLQDVGEYFLQNCQLSPTPQKVSVVYHREIGGCSYQAESETLSITNTFKQPTKPSFLRMAKPTQPQEPKAQPQEPKKS